MKTFAEMKEILEQYSNGLISSAELIVQVQCNEYQMKALHQMLALPQAAYFKVSISDFDESVASAMQKDNYVEKTHVPSSNS